MDFFKKRLKARVIDQDGPLPVGDALESDWADWVKAVEQQQGMSAEFLDTIGPELERTGGVTSGAPKEDIG